LLMPCSCCWLVFILLFDICFGNSFFLSHCAFCHVVS